jgi:metal-responsive CopG/Arc/MetJ family transcriptional regulator
MKEVGRIRGDRATVGRLVGLSADGYTPGMKTAISIPDDLFREADRLAAELKQSRSQLYSRAVREYVARHSADRVTAALDAVYACGNDESELEFLRIAGQRTLEHSEW